MFDVLYSYYIPTSHDFSSIRVQRPDNVDTNINTQILTLINIHYSAFILSLIFTSSRALTLNYAPLSVMRIKKSCRIFFNVFSFQGQIAAITVQQHRDVSSYLAVNEFERIVGTCGGEGHTSEWFLKGTGK